MGKLGVQFNRMFELADRIIPISVVPITAGKYHVPDGTVPVLAKHLWNTRVPPSPFL